jgi:protein-tyrosine-phosphatase
MESKPYNFLFLCTGNSARSIFGEYLLRHLGGSRFRVFSAGSFPTGIVNPFAIQVLKDVYNIDASDARSKSWEEFKDVEFDFVVTVCDHARESCPVWPGPTYRRSLGQSGSGRRSTEATQKSTAPSGKWRLKSIGGCNYLHHCHSTNWTGLN